MTGEVTWHEIAGEDLDRIYRHIGNDSPAAAERFLDGVEHALEVLLANPRAGREREVGAPRLQGTRSWVVRGFENYLIFYLPARGGIEVVRVAHGARDVRRLLGNGH